MKKSQEEREEPQKIPQGKDKNEVEVSAVRTLFPLTEFKCIGDNLESRQILTQIHYHKS